MKVLFQWLRRLLQRVRCDREGCPEAARAYTWPFAGDGDPPQFLCDEHAIEEGFCLRCRGFFLGTDEGVEESGMCAECRAKIL